MSISSERVKLWRRTTKQRMVDAMGSQCQCCGYRRCIESLDFHHIDPAEKELALGAARANPRSWPTIVNELRKCVLVCRNCHGELHHGVRVLPETYARFDERYVSHVPPVELMDECPQCGTPKPSHKRFCTMRCGTRHQHAYPVDWSAYDLKELLKTQRVFEVAQLIGVSQRSVIVHARACGIHVGRPDQKLRRTYTPFKGAKTDASSGAG